MQNKIFLFVWDSDISLKGKMICYTNFVSSVAKIRSKIARYGIVNVIISSYIKDDQVIISLLGHMKTEHHIPFLDSKILVDKNSILLSKNMAMEGYKEKVFFVFLEPKELGTLSPFVGVGQVKLVEEQKGVWYHFLVSK